MLISTRTSSPNGDQEGIIFEWYEFLHDEIRITHLTQYCEMARYD